MIFTGSRDQEDPTWIRMDLATLAFHAHRMHRRLVVVHGAHWEGVDLHVSDWCHDMEHLRRNGRLHVEPYPANWKAFKRSAGPKRNQHMVSLGADLCLAYPLGQSSGTRGCARMARSAGIPTLVTEHGPLAATTLEHRLRMAGITILEEQ